MTIEKHVIKGILIKVITSKDYRMDIVNIINTQFLNFAIEFFKKVVNEKINSRELSLDWYKNAFLRNPNLQIDEVCINSGLNKKTIQNIYGHAGRKIVLDASTEHFDLLIQTINQLEEYNNNEIDLNLTIKFNNVSVDLNITESLLVINTLAVKRAALRGGMWSTIGKQSEKYLMLTLCKMYDVDRQYYDSSVFVKNRNMDVDREVDFYLKNNNKNYRCEVKLMGRGNPESADAIFARNSDLFVADTMSDQNKKQCEQLNICWVCLKDFEGYSRFKLALNKFNIPYSDNFNLNCIENVVDEVINDVER